MADNILYKLRSGKPIKFLDFVKKFLWVADTDVWYRSRRERMLAEARRRPDYAYMQERVDYYIRIHAPWTISAEDKLTRDRSLIHYTGTIGDYRRKMFHTNFIILISMM